MANYPSPPLLIHYFCSVYVCERYLFFILCVTENICMMNNQWCRMQSCVIVTSIAYLLLRVVRFLSFIGKVLQAVSLPLTSVLSSSVARFLVAWQPICLCVHMYLNLSGSYAIAVTIAISSDLFPHCLYRLCFGQDRLIEPFCFEEL